MKTINIKAQGGIELKPVIRIDGKIVECKQSKHESLQTTFQTDKDQVEITVENTLEIMGPGWWFVQMFFFIFSLFGIFNTRLEKFNYLINYKATISLNEEVTNIIIKFNQIKDKQRAIEIIGAAKVEEQANEYQFAEEAKKRKKKLKISRIIGAIAIIAIIAVVLCLVIIK